MSLVVILIILLFVLSFREIKLETLKVDLLSTPLQSRNSVICPYGHDFYDKSFHPYYFKNKGWMESGRQSSTSLYMIFLFWWLSLALVPTAFMMYYWILGMNKD